MMERDLAEGTFSEHERRKRKRYLAATLVTCLALAMLGGVFHVVLRGLDRMTGIRNKASYDLHEEHNRIRAAGEEIYLHRNNRAGDQTVSLYKPDQVQALLSAQQWQEVDSQILIPAGEFTMGTDRARTDLQDQPSHVVSLPAYYIDKYPVTNAQYARFVSATGHRPPLHWKDGKIPDGQVLHPVTMVSWFDAQAYATWAGKRLPSEAQWEKAARGTDARRWPWGSKMDPTRLNTYYNTGSTNEVTHYKRGASPFGVMDMAGNVSEWTGDEFTPYKGTRAPASLFKGKVPKATSAADQAMHVVDMVTVDARYKVMRGGSWKGDPFSTSSYHRNFSWPHYASNFYGFRCAKDAE